MHAAPVAGFANGSLRPVIAQGFSLAEAAKVHCAVIEAPAYGKIVLIPWHGGGEGKGSASGC